MAVKTRKSKSVKPAVTVDQIVAAWPTLVRSVIDLANSLIAARRELDEQKQINFDLSTGTLGVARSHVELQRFHNQDSSRLGAIEWYLKRGFDAKEFCSRLNASYGISASPAQAS